MIMAAVAVSSEMCWWPGANCLGRGQSHYLSVTSDLDYDVTDSSVSECRGAGGYVQQVSVSRIDHFSAVRQRFREINSSYLNTVFLRIFGDNMIDI